MHIKYPSCEINSHNCPLDILVLSEPPKLICEVCFESFISPNPTIPIYHYI